ncbi:MAG: helix-turn-helix transcriptional regulator [Candidatus Limnocylindrales bacterium]|jgi:DNA-binding transcriptional regulator YiaG
MKTSKFRTMRQEMLADPVFRAEVAREKALMAEIDLATARQASGMTQEAVAAGMGKSQENVSRIERQRDVRVSTLAQFIQAQGGQLEINAVFSGKRVSLMRAEGAAPKTARQRA